VKEIPSSHTESPWFKDTFEQYYHSIRNYCYFATGDADMADAFTQDVFIKLWVLRRKVLQHAIKTILYAIANRIVRKGFVDLKPEFHFVREFVWDEKLGRVDSPFIDDEDYKLLQDNLAEIPRLRRTAFLMNQIEGMSPVEISNRLNLRITAVENFIKEIGESLCKQLYAKVSTTKTGYQIEKLEDCPSRLHAIMQRLRVPFSLPEAKAWEMLSQGIADMNRNHRLRHRLMNLGAVLLLLIAVVSVIYDWQFAFATIEAPCGKNAYGRLPDSTVVVLNAGTSISHRKFGFATRRLVALNGEAFFDVKKGELPFRLVVGMDTLCVKEARFNVYSRSEMFMVECLTGEVLVSTQRFPEGKVKSGYGFAIHQSAGNIQLFGINTMEAVSWIRGSYYYVEAPLRMVLDELERQFCIEIQTEGVNIDQCLFSGHFAKTDLKQALNCVCNPLGLKFIIDQKGSTITITSND